MAEEWQDKSRSGAVLPEPARIVMGEVEHLDALAVLMDQYRVFYGQPSNLPAAKHFLFERIISHESVIFLAQQPACGEALGFLQLYPGFSSVSLAPVWTLNDLYVIPKARRLGIARALIVEAVELVRKRGDKGLVLSTAHDNMNAQALYESLGFRQDTQFLHYEYLINAEKASSP